MLKRLLSLTSFLVLASQFSFAQTDNPAEVSNAVESVVNVETATPIEQANSNAPIYVEMKTNKGDIIIELNPEKAPNTVGNFIQYIVDGHYNGTIFHRVIPGFMVQGGGFDTNFTQKATRAPVDIESNNGLSNTKDTIAMARTSDPNSATSQFFINTVDNNFLNYSAENNNPGYTVFGQVIKGMDIAEAIEKVTTESRGFGRDDVPTENIIIEKISLIANPTPATETVTEAAPKKKPASTKKPTTKKK